ncbi:MAG: DUF2971 domain-containing protein [Peptococcaceae bacterium]
MEFESDNTSINYKLLQQSKLNFYKNSKTKQIFHYTSINGLEGILNNKKLHFTNIKYMNDKDEIIAGLESMLNFFEISKEKQEIILSNYMNIKTETFVCCFSLENDSLPMWNYYTKEIHNQGYNIEFDDKKLVESILRQNPFLDGCDFSFGVVEYSKDNNSAYGQNIVNEVLALMKRFIFKNYIQEIEKQLVITEKTVLENWEKEIGDIETRAKELPIYLYNGEKCSFERILSSDYILFIKRDCFKQEQEFRIVITVPDKLLSYLQEKKVYKFRVNNGVLIPYLELSFSAEVVKSITISPTVQSDLIELSIQDFLKYCKLEVSDFSKFIRRSNVPVRF